MLLNFGLPQLAPNIVSAPSPTFNMDSILGLSPSQYSGFKTVANTPYYYGDGNLYETYSPRTVYVRGTGMRPQTYDPADTSINYGMSGQPSGFNIPLSGWQSQLIEDKGTIYKGEQAFRPVQDANVPGFVKSDGAYSPSMAYIYANNPNRYQGTPTQSASSLLNLSTPTANVYNGNYGAGRFLNTGNLLGFNFGTPSGQTTGGQATP
jgi:hypothetical protein